MSPCPHLPTSFNRFHKISLKYLFFLRLYSNFSAFDWYLEQICILQVFLQDAGNVDLALALSFLKLWGGEVFEMVKQSCETSWGDERDEVSVARQA